MDEPQLREAVELVERSADETLSPEDVAQIGRAAQVAFQAIASEVNFGTGGSGLLQTALAAVQFRRDALRNLPGVRWFLGELVNASSVRYDPKVAANLIRDLTGSPFSPTPDVNSEWLVWNDGTVRTLAEAAYERRVLPAGELDGERLTVLADALEDVGADEKLIAHLRSPGPHYRGCFVIDALLAKA